MIGVLSACIILALFCPSFPIVTASPPAYVPNTFTVWITTDEHIDCDTSLYETALTDANNIKEWNISICIGDLVNGAASAANFGKLKTAIDTYSDHIWEDFYFVSSNNDDAQTGVFADYIDPFGNSEERSGVTNAYRKFIVANDSGTYDCCYTISVGNVLFVMWGTTVDVGDGMTPNRDWVLNRIQDTMGNMNVVQCMYDTGWTDATYVSSLATNNADGHLFLITGGQKHWMTSCSHYPADSIRYFNSTLNSYVQYSSGIDTCHGGDESHSWFMTFTEGSTDVKLAGYNHDDSDWNDNANIGGCTGYDNETISMAYAFNYFPDESSFFVDINEGYNGTTLLDSTPNFNWTDVDNFIDYELQIATDKAFTNIIANITNINEFIYSAEFTEGLDISFILPSGNAITTPAPYYCRVRTKTYLKTYI